MLSCAFLAISLFASSGVLGAAIDFSSLPQCAQTPILNTIGRSKCDPSKPQCLCSDDAIVNDLVALIARACTGDDLTKAISFGRALCPNLATQSRATIADAKTTFTITLDSAADGGLITATPVSTSAPASTTEAVLTADTSRVGADGPTASITTTNSTNATSQVNGTGLEQFQGDAPGFGPMRLWSMIIGILMMGAIFAEL